MSKFLKDRAHKPLATGNATLSWGKAFDSDEYFSLSIWESPYRLELTRKDTMSFINFVASHDTFVYGIGEGGMGWQDKRTLPEKLRALADKLEREAE